MDGEGIVDEGTDSENTDSLDTETQTHDFSNAALAVQEKAGSK